MRLTIRRFLLIVLALTLRSAISYASGSTHTIVSLTFDDGLSDAPTAAQIMGQFGFKGTFFIITGELGTPGYMTVSQVQALQAAGHEIGGHTITHPDLTTLTTAQVQHEVCDGRTQLVTMGFQPVDFAYPYGAANSTVESIVSSCYSSGRGGWELDCTYDGCSNAESIPPVDPFWIRTPDAILDTTTLAQLEQYVINAENSGGGWVPLQFHHVCNGDCDSYSITPADLTSFFSWLQARASSGTVVETVNQVLRGIATNPFPGLTKITPNSAVAGGSSLTLTLTGTNFIRSSIVQWSGSPLVTTYTSSTTLTALIPASNLSSPNAVNVTVFTPAPGGGTSAGQPFTITANSSLYTIFGSSAPAAGDGWKDPSSLEVGVHFRSDVAGYVTGLRLYKMSFSTGTHIGNLWTNSGTLLASATFTGETASGWQSVLFPTPVAISSNTLYVASYFTTTGYPVTTPYFSKSIDNPPLHAPASAPGSLNGLYLYNASSAFPPQSTSSNSNYWMDVLFTITGSTGPTPDPVPTLTSISPRSTTVGGSSLTLTLNGSNFISSSTVQWNSSTRPTTIKNSGQLTAVIAAGDIASTGTAHVTVFNPAPGGGTSGAQTFTIMAPPPPPNQVPNLTLIAPSSATVGGSSFTLTLNGTNFIASSTVQWKGSARTTTFISSTSLTALIPVGDIVSSGTATVTVFNPAPGGGTSNAQTFTIAAGSAPPNPVPNLTSMTPSSATVGGSSFTLTLDGSNFISSSSVQWNGLTRTTAFVNSGRLTAFIPSSDMTSAETATVTVFNPTPGGGASNGILFTINASTSTSGPWTLWGSTATPNDGWKDPSPLEVGVRFRSDMNGYITGIRFYKGSFNTGNHIGHLWTNTGALLATVTFTGETTSGWQTVYFASPVAITANTTYVASYFTTTGYSVNINYFTANGVDNTPLHALTTGVDGLNGIYLYSATSVFPTQSANSSNYWVDVVFNTTPTHAGSSFVFLPPAPVSGKSAFTDFTQFREYPNPWRSDRPNNGHITFDQLPFNCTVKIFTVSARWVKTLDAPGGFVQWDLTNNAGEPVASGYYIYLMTMNEGAQKRGTLAIIR